MSKHLLITISLLLVTSFISFGQKKIEKYCSVKIITKNGFSSKWSASIYLGENSSLLTFRDSLVILKLQKVSEAASALDILNYMSSLGWSLVNFVFPFNNGAADVIYFKKEFDTSELINPTN